MASRHIWRALRNGKCLASVCLRSCPLTTGHTVQSVNRQPLFRQITAARIHTTTPCANEHIINIQDEEDFKDRVLNNNTPVIVDFHAHWCGPCKLLGPRLESLIAGKSGSVILAKVDIDENSDLAIEHGVEAVPTVLAVKNGKIVDKFIGLRDDVALEGFVNSLIGK